MRLKQLKLMLGWCVRQSMTVVSHTDLAGYGGGLRRGRGQLREGVARLLAGMRSFCWILVTSLQSGCNGVS